MPVPEMFSPKHYEGGAQAAARSRDNAGMDATRRRTFYRREVERIWKKVWNFIGSVESNPQPGRLFHTQFRRRPVIVSARPGQGHSRVRQTCRHRGSELLDGQRQLQADRMPVPQLDL